MKRYIHQTPSQESYHQFFLLNEDQYENIILEFLWRDIHKCQYQKWKKKKIFWSKSELSGIVIYDFSVLEMTKIIIILFYLFIYFIFFFLSKRLYKNGHFFIITTPLFFVLRNLYEWKFFWKNLEKSILRNRFKISFFAEPIFSIFSIYKGIPLKYFESGQNMTKL